MHLSPLPYRPPGARSPLQAQLPATPAHTYGSHSPLPTTSLWGRREILRLDQGLRAPQGQHLPMCGHLGLRFPNCTMGYPASGLPKAPSNCRAFTVPPPPELLSPSSPWRLSLDPLSSETSLVQTPLCPWGFSSVWGEAGVSFFSPPGDGESEAQGPLGTGIDGGRAPIIRETPRGLDLSSGVRSGLGVWRGQTRT